MRPFFIILSSWSLVVSLTTTYGFTAPTVPSHRFRHLTTTPEVVPVPVSRLGPPGRRLTTGTALASSAIPIKKEIIKRTVSNKKSIVKGKLYRNLSKFLVSPRRASEIVKALVLHVSRDWDDIALIALCIKAPLPLARKMYFRRHKTLDPDLHSDRFLRSKTKKVATVVNEIGWLLAFLYYVDISLFMLDQFGFDFVTKFPVQDWMTGIVVSLWGAKNLSEIKYWLLNRGNRKRSSTTRVINRFADLLIYVGTIVAILDFLSVQTGWALGSLFGLSSVGTLIFSLSSKELVSEFLANLAIQGTNMYTEGETILLKDGTMGKVQKIGWLNTHIRRSDEVVVRIPNTQISGARVANISRTTLSAIKQGIAISYEEMDKIPQLIEDIKSEIRKSCPTLIDDNDTSSRRFRLYWKDFKEKSIEITVDAKFRTRPKCDDYYELRQEVLLAIARATKKNKIAYSFVSSGNVGTPLLD